MNDEHLHPETGSNLGTPVEDEPVGTPRWVKVSLIIAAVLVLLLVIFLLLGGDHGPGRHMALDGGLSTPSHSSHTGL